jgi:hypothetical protein
MYAPQPGASYVQPYATSAQPQAYPGYPGAAAKPAQAIDREHAPRSMAEAVRSPNGRPAVALACFGFGGKVILSLPRPTTVVPLLHATMAPPQLAVTSVPLLLETQSAIVEGREVDPGAALADPLRAAMEDFPGPLMAGVKVERVLKYLDARVEHCGEEEPHHEAAHVLWELLRVMARNQGQLRSQVRGWG